jgi:hypothetical protein
MTGQLASPANWQPQPERSTPRHGAGGVSGGARRARGLACRMCCCRHRALPLLREDAWHPACHPPMRHQMRCRRRTCCTATFSCAAGPASDVSFCITELPEYLVLDMVRGPGPDVVHVASAFTYTLLMLLVNYAACLPRVTRRRQAWLPHPPWPALAIQPRDAITTSYAR